MEKKNERNLMGRPICGLKHRLEVRGGKSRFVCCDSRECRFQEVIDGVKYCLCPEEKEGDEQQM